MIFQIDSKFSGIINISSSYYTEKPTGKEISKIVFHEMKVTNDMLSSFISNGYCYCPTQRKLEQVATADYICIDVDDSTVEMKDYVRNLTDIPTIYYTTPSDRNVEKSMKKFGDDKHIYRFRLVYALSTPTINAVEYQKAYRYIVSTNNMYNVDERPANQYYNGSLGCEIYNTNKIYSLPDEYKEIKVEEKSKLTIPNKLDNSLLDKSVLENFLKCKKYEDFLYWYFQEYGEGNLLRESLYIEDETDKRKMICSEYLVIPKKYLRWDKEKKIKIWGKWSDGENRHVKLFLTGIILRKLNPLADANDLFRELISILLSYYNLFNSDKTIKFNKEVLLKLFNNVMKADIERELKPVKHSSFKVNIHYCQEKSISKKKVVIEILSDIKKEKKEKKYKLIDTVFNPNLKSNNSKKITQKEWIEILKENGIEVNERTFRRYLLDRGFSKKKKGHN